MIESFNHLQHCPPEFEYNDNDYMLSIRVTFNDDSYLTFYRTSSFGNNSMYQQAIRIINLIPMCEDIPAFLKPFKETVLTKELFEQVKNEDIMGIFYGGDMGRIGGVDIVTSDYKLFSSDLNQGDIKVHEFASKFSTYKKLYDCDFINNRRITVDNEDWYPLYLGAGNRVFLNDRLNDDLIEYLFNVNRGISYKKWNMLILD